MRLIDTDVLESVAAEYQERHPDNPLTRNEYKLIDRFLFEYPTAEAAPIKYGTFYTDDDPDEWYGRSNSCASCKSVWLGPTQYCPNCGAKLKKVALQINNDEYNRWD
jgi:hypothetical protein